MTLLHDIFKKHFVKKFFFFFLLLNTPYSILHTCHAQQLISSDTLSLDYSKPIEYEIAGVTISGAGTLDNSVLLSLAGLYVGDKIKIPGDATPTAIKNLWKEGFFEDVKIVATKIQGKNIFLEIQVKERARLSKFQFKGVKKGEADDLREKLHLNRGKVVTENLIVTAKTLTLEHFIDKGFLNAKVVVAQEKDTSLLNSLMSAGSTPSGDVPVTVSCKIV